MFAGTSQVAVPSLTAIVAAGHDVVAVLTRPDAPRGRGKQLAASPVALEAAELGIPALKPTSLRDPGFLAELARLAPEACPVVAYGNLVPAAALAIPTRGWVNLHFSLLPAWRGAAPVQRAIINGDTRTGVTTFLLVPELDAGPLFRVLERPIGINDHASDILDSLAERGARVLVDTLDDLARGVTPTPQGDQGVSYAPKLTPEDARIDWAQPAGRIHNLVRGTDPAPGAWTTLAGERFKVLRTSPEPDCPVLEPGRIGADKHHLWVGTGTDALALVTVQPVGRKPMAGADWARGVHLDAGARFV